jgi:hypothetical protein
LRQRLINNVKPCGRRAAEKQKGDAMKKYPVINEFVFDERPVCVYGNTYIQPAVNSLPVRIFQTAARRINKFIQTISRVWQN